MEQMMGVKEPLPDVLSGGNIKRRRRRLLDAVHLGRTLAGLVGNHFTLSAASSPFTIG